jgi:hypothetical protein
LVCAQKPERFSATQFGQNGDKPTPAAPDGDGKSGIDVRRGRRWMIKRSSDETANPGAIFGLATGASVQPAFVR